MSRLPLEKRAKILRLLVEGNSIRSASRITDVSKNTVTKLLADVGSQCLDFQDEVLRDLPCKRLQCDEIWSFCHAKQKNAPDDKKGEFGYGDVWTWTALCADTKLVPCWHVGNRTAQDAKLFMQDLASRLSSRIQLTTDGHRVYIDAVENAFGADVDYAMLVKLYGTAPDSERRYSPAECCGIEKQRMTGSPDSEQVSTSYVEGQNLTMRMSMRRFIRLTNASSTKVENLAHAMSLHYMYYNFGRIHKTLRVTPAMAAGVSNHVWEVEEIVSLDG